MISILKKLFIGVILLLIPIVAEKIKEYLAALQKVKDSTEKTDEELSEELDEEFEEVEEAQEKFTSTQQFEHLAKARAAKAAKRKEESIEEAPQEATKL